MQWSEEEFLKRVREFPRWKTSSSGRGVSRQDSEAGLEAAFVEFLTDCGTAPPRHKLK